jgi:hypothetical protein
MSPSSTSGSRPGLLSLRSRSGRALAGTVAATMVVTGLTLAGGQSATAATAAAADSAPQAQAVGNYLDATLGGNTLDAIAKLAYATAKAPGSTSVQNPLDVTLLGALNLPLTGALQLPSLLGIDLGAVTQKASANVNGKSYGQVGTALNQGGVSIGGSDPKDLAGNATINLSAAGLAGNSPIAIPGGTGSAAALGGITATVGAISAVAQTPEGVDNGATTAYQIANLDLSIGSPLIGSLLAPVGSLVGGVLKSLASATSAIPGAAVPADCTLLSGTLPNLSLEGGAVTIVSSGADAGTITISLDKLLKQLGLNLNALPANTDLIAYLLAYLASPNGLAKGLQGAIDGLLVPLADQFTACSAALNAIPLLGPILVNLVKTLTNGQKTLETTVSGLVGSLAGAAGVNPLAPIASLLSNLIDIGVNVQPNGPAGPAGAAYVEHLNKTPKQGTPVVANQTIVRAIEINVAAAGGSALPSLPGLPTLPGLGAVSLSKVAQNIAAAPNSGILTLALANAAAGPSAAAPTAPANGPTAPATPANPAITPAANVPTAVESGEGTHGSPLAPLLMLIVGLLMAGAGSVAWKFRGRNVV